VSARLSLVPAPKHRSKHVLPTVVDLAAIPLSTSGEFELNEKEVRQTRNLIYSINKQGMIRYRTMRDGRYLQVWRIK